MIQNESGVNKRGNRWRTPGGRNSNSSTSYHYSNDDGSYYYKNDDGSTYFNPGRGSAGYYTPKGSSTGRWCGSKTENKMKSSPTPETEPPKPQQLKVEQILQNDASSPNDSKHKFSFFMCVVALLVLCGSLFVYSTFCHMISFTRTCTVVRRFFFRKSQ